MNREEAKRRAKELVSKMTVEEKASQLKYDAAPIQRLNIPGYNWWNEALHGVARAGTATVFPQAIGMAATFDCNLIKQVADAIATEGRAKYNQYSQHEDRDIYNLTLKMTQIIEDTIRAYPDEWLWFQKRWNTPPDERHIKHHTVKSEGEENE